MAKLEHEWYGDFYEALARIETVFCRGAFRLLWKKAAILSAVTPGAVCGYSNDTAFLAAIA